MNSNHTKVPGTEITIEPSNWRDLGPVRHIEQVCFPKDSWPLLDLIGVLTMPNVVRLKAVDNGQMVGFIAGDIRQSQKVSWIATVGVLPGYRGRGVGETLIRACEERLPTPTVRLNVRVSNDPAIHLYQRLGYAHVGRWHAYYEDGEDALVMEKTRLGG